VTVACRDLDDQARQVLCQVMAEFRVIGDFYRTDTHNFSGGFSHGSAILARNQQVDIAADLLSGSNGVQSCNIDFIIVVFNDYQITPD
jgi:hypothetical protein